MKQDFAYCLVHESLIFPDLPTPTNRCIVVYAPIPEELDLDGWEWTMSLPIPDAEELAHMNQSAKELEMDFS